MPLLKETGVIDVIVGLEAISTEGLENYDKAYTARENEKCVQILEKYDISLTALFIANTDYTLDDFRNLRRWMNKMGIKLFTVSIFTPVPGTKEFEGYKDKLITNDYKKWDYIHHVLEPTHLSKTRFYFEVFSLYARHYFVNKSIRRMVYQYAIRKFLTLTKIKKMDNKYTMPKAVRP